MPDRFVSRYNGIPYDSQGELRGKHKFALPSLTMEIPQQGTYVLVMSHPNCQPEVRRFTYSGI